MLSQLLQPPMLSRGQPRSAHLLRQTGAESGTRTRVNCLADSRTSRCTISAWQGKLELNQSECFQRALPKPLGHSPVKLGSG